MGRLVSGPARKSTIVRSGRRTAHDECEESVNDGLHPALAEHVDAMLAQSDGWRLTRAPLPRREQVRLREAGPWDSEAFTDALFHAEGMTSRRRCG